MPTPTAYAVAAMQIKSMDESGEVRRFTGLATTPTPDRVGDIVEPKGAQFKLPVPLLWQHDARSPIGWVMAARVDDKGIEVDCELAKCDRPGKLKDQLDYAWDSVKAKLVAGLSIGFKPVESARIGDTYSYRYLKWLWLELSAVTVAANGDCSIESIKSIDRAFRSAARGALPVVRLGAGPAVSGEQRPGDSGASLRRKGVVYLKP